MKEFKYKWMNPFAKYSWIYFVNTDSSIDYTFKQIITNNLKYIWERLKAIINTY